MIVTTKDLIKIAQCPKRWISDPEWRKESKDIRRDTFTSLIIQSELKDKSKVLDILTDLWDKAYWADKKWTKETETASNKITLSTMKLVSKIPTDITVYSPLELDLWIDTICLRSAAEFILHDNKSDEIQVWISGQKEILYSPLPLAEAFLIDTRCWISQPKIKIIIFNFTESNFSKVLGFRWFVPYRNEAVIKSLLSLIKSGGFPSAGKHCRGCEIACWEK